MVTEESKSHSRFGELLTVNEVMDITKLGRTTVYRLMDAGKIHSIRIGTSRRITGESIEKLLTESSVE